MAIVIREFEAVVEPPPATPPRENEPGESAAGPARPPEPRELEPVLRALADQAARVWAH